MQHWVTEKEYGFIKPDRGGPDVFCHRRQLEDERLARVGTKVVFERATRTSSTSFNERSEKDRAERVRRA